MHQGIGWTKILSTGYNLIWKRFSLSYEHHLSCSENNVRKREQIQTYTGFEPMISAIPVQRSTTELSSQLGAISQVYLEPTETLAVGLLAQLVEQCTGIAEVIGSNPVHAWIFFRPYFHYCLSSVYNCEGHFYIRFFDCSSHIWFSYIYSHLFTTSWVYLEPT